MITGKIMLRIAFHILKILTVAIPKTINMAIFMPTNPFIDIKNILKIVWDQLSLFTQNDILSCVNLKNHLGLVYKFVIINLKS